MSDSEGHAAAANHVGITCTGRTGWGTGGHLLGRRTGGGADAAATGFV